MSPATRRDWVGKQVLRGDEPFTEYDAIETAVGQALIAKSQSNVLGAVFPVLRPELRSAVVGGSSDLWAVIASDGYDCRLARSSAEAGEYAASLSGLAWTVPLRDCIEHARERYGRAVVQLGNAKAAVQSLNVQRVESD